MQSLRSVLIDRAELLTEQALARTNPIWNPVTTRELGRLLGVSVQALANWRVRDLGPPFERAGRGKGNKCLYRTDQVLEWLTGVPAWKYDRAWLAGRGLAAEDAEQPYVEWAKEVVA